MVASQTKNDWNEKPYYLKDLKDSNIETAAKEFFVEHRRI